jgi:heme exporter protein D
MNWHSPAEFFAMGGYGLYVWGAYAVTAACLLIEPVLAARRHRRGRDAAPSLSMRGETILDASR